MPLATASDIFRQLLRANQAVCVECNREPDRVELGQSPGYELGDPMLVLTAWCCHRKERLKTADLYAAKDIKFDRHEIRMSEIGDDFARFDWKPCLRFFRRNWAAYRRPTIRELLEARK